MLFPPNFSAPSFFHSINFWAVTACMNWLKQVTREKRRNTGISKAAVLSFHTENPEEAMTLQKGRNTQCFACIFGRTWIPGSPLKGPKWKR